MATLTHSPADVVRYALIDQSLGTLPINDGSWPIYVNREPDSPDSCITIYDTTDVKQGRIQIDGAIVQKRGIQIRVRAKDHETAWPKADAISDNINETILLTSVTISLSTYVIHAIHQESGPVNLGKEVESSKRNVFTINALVDLKQTA